MPRHDEHTRAPKRHVMRSDATGTVISLPPDFFAPPGPRWCIFAVSNFEIAKLSALYKHVPATGTIELDLASLPRSDGGRRTRTPCGLTLKEHLLSRGSAVEVHGEGGKEERSEWQCSADLDEGREGRGPATSRIGLHRSCR